ncbi:zinc-binding dehydrogenase [Micromonospora krabiensis]|uniref:NADPH:quinone reductase n=1 Tax=Micromonospora krabiensis TaxID=307121 RepID=A0A1C3MX66_9ACTN|nr:zinc-binding dehydrogenase [Micromonospora krabiensis]SBV24894.1 NADPH:quinone reductase [Micromonospora krabiensis]
MRAIVAAPDTGPRWRLADVAEPVPRADQVLVEVEHVSVNHGEVRHVAAWPAGAVLGHDAVGRVLRAAASGTGPRVGDRVVALGPGAWAQRAAFDVDAVAVLPSGLDGAALAALPTVGLTALRALRSSGPLLASRVLVTGASGGVGRIAVQLARRGGARVIAVVGAPERADGLAELGADEVVVGVEAVAGPVDVVVETLGGGHLSAAWRLLSPGGVLHSIGWASGDPATFPVNSTFAPGAARSLRSAGDASAPGADLALLVDLVRTGALHVPVGWHGSWRRLDDAAGALLSRRVLGKVLLDVD